MIALLFVAIGAVAMSAARIWWYRTHPDRERRKWGQ